MLILLLSSYLFVSFTAKNLRFFKFNAVVKFLSTNFSKNIDMKKLNITPISNEIAKPLIVPVPIKYKTHAEINVVILE